MRKARSGGQRTNLRRRYTTRSWLIPSSHVRVNACGGVLVLTQRITARAIQKFTHCALNTNPISKFPILPPLPLAHLRWKNCYLLSLFVSNFKILDCDRVAFKQHLFLKISIEFEIFSRRVQFVTKRWLDFSSLQKFFDSFVCLLLSPKFLSSFDFYQFYWIEFWTRFKISYHFFGKSLLSWKIL